MSCRPGPGIKMLRIKMQFAAFYVWERFRIAYGVKIQYLNKNVPENAEKIFVYWKNSTYCSALPLVLLNGHGDLAYCTSGMNKLKISIKGVWPDKK